MFWDWVMTGDFVRCGNAIIRNLSGQTGHATRTLSHSVVARKRSDEAISSEFENHICDQLKTLNAPYTVVPAQAGTQFCFSGFLPYREEFTTDKTD